LLCEQARATHTRRVSSFADCGMFTPQQGVSDLGGLNLLEKVSKIEQIARNP
jgi:hypothetical protein